MPWPCPSPPSFAFCLALSLLPAACAVGDKAAHAFSGYPGNCPVSALRASGTSRAGVNRYAIKHNRALCKAQAFASLRCARCSVPLRALRVRIMVGYVLRPSPDNSYFSAAYAAFVYSGAARARWCGSPPAQRVGLRRLALRCSFPPRPPRSRPPQRGSPERQRRHWRTAILQANYK